MPDSYLNRYSSTFHKIAAPKIAKKAYSRAEDKEYIRNYYLQCTPITFGYLVLLIPYLKANKINVYLEARRVAKCINTMLNSLVSRLG